MVLLMGASCLDNAFRSLSYTSRMRLKKIILLESINPLKNSSKSFEKGIPGIEEIYNLARRC